jgi:hypothetical protein
LSNLKDLKMQKIFTIAAVLLVSACASPEQIAASQAKVVAKHNAIAEIRETSGVVKCADKEQCDKFFRIASDVIIELSDMKIQSSTPNYISTYNPIKYGFIGMTARRTLGAGAGEIVRLDVNCRGMEGSWPLEGCFDRVAYVYKVFNRRTTAEK